MGDLGKIKAWIEVKGMGSTYKWDARVARTYPVASRSTRTTNVVLIVDDPYNRKRANGRPQLLRDMFCHVVLEGPEKTGQVVIPRLAVHEGKVYVANGDRLKIKEVTIDRLQGDIAVLADGLQPGERLVVSRIVTPIEGMLLNDVNAPKKPKGEKNEPAATSGGQAEPDSNSADGAR
ncbi:MAG: hypothetical protein Kow00107_01840 [Planctomycetota bacterium]